MVLLRTRPSRLRAALLVSALAATALAGCGDDGSARAGDAGRGGDPSGEVGRTVAIEHRFGTTRAPVHPERIISLDAQWTDVLVALGAPPVGYIRDPNIEGGNFPWRGDRLAEATGMTATDALPWEQITELDPDLIVVSYFAQDEADYERLSAIAPTITTLSDGQVDAWQDITRTAGTVLDYTAGADALIEEVEGSVAALAEEIPGIEGKTFALVNFVPGDAFYVVSDPKDGAVVLFDQLGLAISPTILDAGEGVSGRVELSLEQAELLDVDVLLLLTNGGETDDIVGYEDLPAVRSGAVAVLDYADASGLNTPSPLSVPYCLDLIRPALEAAAAT